MKYKVGDKVVLRSLSSLEREFGKYSGGYIKSSPPLTPGMQSILKNKEEFAIITEVRFKSYRFEEQGYFGLML